MLLNTIGNVLIFLANYVALDSVIVDLDSPDAITVSEHIALPDKIMSVFIGTDDVN
jgi:hypothetical protein